MNDQHIPVLVGVGQTTEHPQPNNGASPLELMVRAATAAIDDAGLSKQKKHITTVAATGLTVDADMVKTPFKKAYSNLAHSVGVRLGLKDFATVYAATGGNTPQFLVNHYAGEILQGKEQTVLLTGGEALDTMFKRFSPFYKLLFAWNDWREKTSASYVSLGDDSAGNTKTEGAYKMNLPAHVYPIFENALAKHYDRSPNDHRLAIGEMFSRFTSVAAANPYAWFQTERSAEELITEAPHNRMIAFPYTKYLNSIIKVNQAAAVILTSVANAKKMGVSSDRWVYVSGFADQNDHWYVSQRENYHSSPAIRTAGQRALAMAGVGIDDLAYFDIYSCFPSSVQIACDELGIQHNDSRGLTVTGGLPYFGGPGNNYTMHAIAEMVGRLRNDKGAQGLVNANGWYLTKHAIGIYSSAPPKTSLQNLELTKPAALDPQRAPEFTEFANGSARVETFTFLCDKKNQPTSSIIIGRDSKDRRFIANGDIDKATIDFMRHDANVIGSKGHVYKRGRKNHFRFE